MKFSRFQKSQDDGENKSDIPVKKEKTEEKKFDIKQTDSDSIKSPAVSKIEERDIKFSIKSEKLIADSLSLSDFIKNNIERLEMSARETYAKAVETSKELMNSLYLPYFEKYYQIDYAVSKIYTQLKDNPFFIRYASFITPANYLYSHNVNTAIIAMDCAIALNYPKEKTIDLGCAAFLHDIGINDFLDIIKQERTLSAQEKEIIREHSQRSVEYLDKITDLEYEKKQILSSIIIQTHERYDGSGYPYAIKGEEQSETASLLSIADVYESLSHKRNWREAYESPTAMKFFLNDLKNQFNPKALKGLISSQGMYPPESLVKLSTGEIACVILANKKNLTRPVVEIILDGDFVQTNKHYLDLTEYPLTAIEEEALFGEIADRNPSFYSSWEMKHFWIDWG
ncbi:MAG: HD domain-containing protein [Elusimicrobia bacterium]|nr:HD domain-containing protein [Elusimicrobiota bacterium]